jgi:hypothetical protein
LLAIKIKGITQEAFGIYSGINQLKRTGGGERISGL